MALQYATNAARPSPINNPAPATRAAGGKTANTPAPSIEPSPMITASKVPSCRASPGCVTVVRLRVPVFLVSVGVDHGLETVRIQVALQRLVGALKIKSAGDQRVELNQAAGHHVYACRPGVGVAED